MDNAMITSIAQAAGVYETVLTGYVGIALCLIAIVVITFRK